jgi:hypothetical protein
MPARRPLTSLIYVVVFHGVTERVILYAPAWDGLRLSHDVVERIAPFPRHCDA